MWSSHLVRDFIVYVLMPKVSIYGKEVSTILQTNGNGSRMLGDEHISASPHYGSSLFLSPLPEGEHESDILYDSDDSHNIPSTTHAEDESDSEEQQSNNEKEKASTVARARRQLGDHDYAPAAAHNAAIFPSTLKYEYINWNPILDPLTPFEVPVSCNFKEAMKFKNASLLKRAIEKEMGSMATDDVYDLVPTPKKQRIVRAKWVRNTREAACRFRATGFKWSFVCKLKKSLNST